MEGLNTIVDRLDEEDKNVLADFIYLTNNMELDYPEIYGAYERIRINI